MLISRDDYDSPWKEVIEHFLPDFLAFFFPPAFQEIDWDREPSFLDKELQQVRPDAEQGRRVVDKLVRVHLTRGTEVWVLIHIEVQAEREADFAERMFTYHYRLLDRFKRPLVSLAILGDPHPDWKPEAFASDLWGYGVTFTFRSVKLLEYEPDLAHLEASSNPFALVVLAHLMARRTRGQPEARLGAKLALARKLYALGYNRVGVLRLFRFIDWVLRLPEDLDDRFWQDWRAYEEEHRMRYVTSVERIGRREGRKEGREEGLKEGTREGLLAGIELGLTLKFGASGNEIMPDVRQLTDVSVLWAIHRAIAPAQTIDDVRRVFRPTG